MYDDLPRVRRWTLSEPPSHRLDGSKIMLDCRERGFSSVLVVARPILQIPRLVGVSHDPSNEGGLARYAVSPLARAGGVVSLAGAVVFGVLYQQGYTLVSGTAIGHPASLIFMAFLAASMGFYLLLFKAEIQIHNGEGWLSVCGGYPGFLREGRWQGLDVVAVEVESGEGPAAFHTLVLELRNGERIGTLSAQDSDLVRAIESRARRALSR